MSDTERQVMEHAALHEMAVPRTLVFRHQVNKDTPITRPIERFGRVIAEPMLGGLHHHYARI